MLPFKRFLMALPALAVLFSSTVNALGQQQVVCFEGIPEAFPLVSGGSASAILVSDEDSNGVKRAGQSTPPLSLHHHVQSNLLIYVIHLLLPAHTFAKDISNVTNQYPTVLSSLSETYNSSGSHVVLVGSVGSPFVTTLVNAGAMNVSDIEGRWESFKIEIVDGSAIGVERALVVVGSE
jgi:hypothetical protein